MKNSIDLYEQRGQVMLEWTLATLVVTLMLFTPLTADNRSLAGLVMEGIRAFYQNQSFLLSLP